MSAVLGRDWIDRVIAVAGLAIVVWVVYGSDISLLHAVALAIGILMLYVGSWRLVGYIFGRPRANKALRAEIEEFIALVRTLYAERTSGDSAGLHETKAQLREKCERIISAATYPEPRPTGPQRGGAAPGGAQEERADAAERDVQQRPDDEADPRP